MQIRFVKALGEPFGHVCIQEAPNASKRSHNFEAKYTPVSCRSTVISCVDEVLHFIDMIYSGVNDRALSAVGAVEEIFIQIHQEGNSQGDIYISMAIHKFSLEMHIQNDHLSTSLRCLLIRAPD